MKKMLRGLLLFDCLSIASLWYGKCHPGSDSLLSVGHTDTNDTEGLLLKTAEEMRGWGKSKLLWFQPKKLSSLREAHSKSLKKPMWPALCVCMWMHTLACLDTHIIIIIWKKNRLCRSGSHKIRGLMWFDDTHTILYTEFLGVSSMPLV